MRPDTSHWRDRARYDYFETLAPEGLAWECLRRWDDYQAHFDGLVAARTEAEACSREDQLHWGLRFPGPAGSRRAERGRLLVPVRRSCHRSVLRGARLLRPATSGHRPALRAA